MITIYKLQCCHANSDITSTISISDEPSDDSVIDSVIDSKGQSFLIILAHAANTTGLCQVCHGVDYPWQLDMFHEQTIY